MKDKTTILLIMYILAAIAWLCASATAFMVGEILMGVLSAIAFVASAGVVIVDIIDSKNLEDRKETNEEDTITMS